MPTDPPPEPHKPRGLSTAQRREDLRRGFGCYLLFWSVFVLPPILILGYVWGLGELGEVPVLIVLSVPILALPWWLWRR